MNKRIIALLLSVISVCSFAVGCKDKPEDGGEVNATQKYKYTEGVHDFTAPETNEYMVQDGKSDYKILLPANADSNLIVAESELKLFFEKATGVQLESIIETGDGIEHTENAKYISLGKTKMLESANIEIDAQRLGTQGLQIVTKDKTIYVTGASTVGTLNGVYGLLNILFDYEQYAYDCYTINETRNVKLRNFNVMDIPDIEMRCSSWKLLENNPENLQYRLRMRGNGEYILPVGDTENGAAEATIHNSSNVLPKNAPTSRESWFSDQSGTGADNTQVCYTAHGNQEDYNAMVDRIAYVIERSLMKYTPDKYPLRNVVTFTHEDNENTMCRCNWCVEAHEKYGAQSGAALVLCNNVRAKLEEWMNLPENAAYKRENLTLVFFAYAAFVEAPAHYDEAQGKYVINHPDLEMRDDVGVYYAISSGLNYQLNIYDKASENGVENSLKWFDISSSVYLWTYDANFGNYLFRTAGTNFYDTDAYQFFAAGGAKFMYNQCDWSGANATSFQMLDIWLDAKMQWDTTQDINELTKRWFKGMFKEAADVMYDLYVQENTWALIVANEMGKIAKTGIINYSIGMEYWKYEMLKGWLDKIDEARSLIAKYETRDPVLYKALKEHIDIEWVCPAYYMLTCAADSLSNETYNEMVTYFKTDISQLKDFQFAERSFMTISDWASDLSLR